MGQTGSTTSKLPSTTSSLQSESRSYATDIIASGTVLGTNVGGDTHVTGNVHNIFHISQNQKVNTVLTSFRLINAPTSHFIGRKSLLRKIHTRFKKCSSKTRYEERIVVIHGLGGMGKTETARKYVEKYINDSIIQNVAWIDAESETSLKQSFVYLAKILKLEMPSDEDKINAEQLAKDIYQHFSDHVHNGLFVFDNSLQMTASDKYFGISKYLPVQHYDKLPLILITARTREWKIPTRNRLIVQELHQDESFKFLRKKLNLTQAQNENESVRYSVNNLAFALGGYPLGLTLAASNIENRTGNDLCVEIESYLERVEKPVDRKKWIDDALSEEDSNNYPLIMSNVWNASFEKIKSKGKVGEEAMKLLKIMAYMPPDQITRKEVEEIFSVVFNKEIDRECFVILADSFLITILGPDSKSNYELSHFRIQIHRLVQHFMRIKQQEEKDDGIVIQYCIYLSRLGRHDHLLIIFKHLINYWPANTQIIQFSILLSCGCDWSENKQLQNQLKILFEYFQNNCDQHFLLQIERMEENEVKLLMLCLYYYQNFHKSYYGNRPEFEDPHIEKQKILDSVLPLFKSYFGFLLYPSTVIENENEDISIITQKHVHEMCYQTLTYGFFRNDGVELHSLLVELIELGDLRLGRKETAGKLYTFLGTYLTIPNLAHLGINRAYSSKYYMNCILKIHKRVYPTIDQNSEEEMRNYWGRGGPFDRSLFDRRSLFKDQYYEDWTEIVFRVVKQSAFFFRGVCKVLEHQMHYLSVYYVQSRESTQFISFILKCVEEFEFSPQLVSDGLFVKHFHLFVVNHLFTLDLNVQIHCLWTYMGLFSKNIVLEDNDGGIRSIRSVAHQINEFQVVVNDLREENFSIGFRRSQEYLQDFIKLHENVNDQETQAALAVAALFLKKFNNWKPSYKINLFTPPMTPMIGIDLGTTNCCVAVLQHTEPNPEVILNDFGKKTTKNFVAYDEEGDIYVGQTAQYLAFDNLDSTVFDAIRLIGRSHSDPYIQKFKNLRPFSLVSIEGIAGIQVGENTLFPRTIVKELIAHLRKISKNYLVCHIQSAVVTVPAYFNNFQQILTRQACHEAGLETVHFIKEPTAIAYALGLQSTIQPGQYETSLIFDLGGSTLDITVIKLGSEKRVEILACGGDPRLGGEDFTDLLTEYCINEFKRMHSIDLVAGKNSEDAAVRLKTAKSLHKIRTDCEKKKKQLSNINSVKIYADEVTRDLDMIVPVTRKVFEDLIDCHLQRCIATMDYILRRNGIAKESIDNVVFIGGSSRIPKVQQLVREFFEGKQLHQINNAEEIVACGAAVYAYNMFANRAAGNTVTVVDETAYTESYASTDLAQPQQFLTITTNSNSTEAIDQSEEILFNDLQVLKEIIIKHMVVFLDDLLMVDSWLQNFGIFENDFMNNLEANPLEKQIIIRALLETELLPELANILWERYEYKENALEALKLNETILKRYTSLLGQDHLKTIEAQFQVAKCFDLLNGVNNTLYATNALDLYQIVLEKRKRILGESHKDTLTVKYWIATVLENHGKYQDALNLAEEVHKMQSLILGPENIETLASHVWVAYCLLQLQSRKEAMELGLNLHQKLQLFTNDNSRIVVQCKYMIACVLKRTNKLNEAFSLFEDVCKANSLILGEDHLQVISTKENMALCLIDLMEYSKAFEIYTSVLSKRLEILGPYHRSTLEAAHNTAFLLRNQGKLKEAASLFADVWQGRMLTLGLDNTDTVKTRREIVACASQLSCPGRNNNLSK